MQNGVAHLAHSDGHFCFAHNFGHQQPICERAPSLSLCQCGELSEAATVACWESEDGEGNGGSGV